MQCYKCFFIGDGNVGKTSLIIRYTKNVFPFNSVTVGAEFHLVNVQVDGKSKNLQLWESAGHERYDCCRCLFYKETDVFVIYFSVACPESFRRVKSKWFSEISQHFSSPQVILVGTQVDRRSTPNTMEEHGQQTITYQQGLTLANEINAIKYLECSAKTRNGLKLVIDEVARATFALEPKTLRNVEVQTNNQCMIC